MKPTLQNIGVRRVFCQVYMYIFANVTEYWCTQFFFFFFLNNSKLMKAFLIVLNMTILELENATSYFEHK